MPRSISSKARQRREALELGYPRLRDGVTLTTSKPVDAKPKRVTDALEPVEARKTGFPDRREYEQDPEFGFRKPRKRKGS